jgi:hypothetical protein
VENVRPYLISLKAKLPHQARSLYGHDLGEISPAERRLRAAVQKSATVTAR